MTVYTSYYSGEIKGEAIAISIYPPPNWKGKHLPLFAPTKELLQWWKQSPKDAGAIAHYEHQFLELLHSRQQLIELWVGKQQQSSADITLLCYEPSGQFCHRHIVGQEVIEKYLPEKWGGEVSSSLSQNHNSDSASISEDSVFKTENPPKDTSSIRTPEANTPKSSSQKSPARSQALTRPRLNDAKSNIPASCPPVIVGLLAKCHESGYPVRCVPASPVGDATRTGCRRHRLNCGYYRVSLHGKGLGEWSELGLLGVLSGLRQEFYRERLLS